MTTSTVTEQGQVTFERDALKHLGIRPGGRIRLDLLPNGRAGLVGDEQPQGSWDGLRNLFAGQTNGAQLSLGELDDTIAVAGAASNLSGTTGR